MGQRSQPRRTSHVWRVVVALGLGFLTNIGFVVYGWYVLRANENGAGPSKPAFAWGLREGAEGRAWDWTTMRWRWYSTRTVMASGGQAGRGTVRLSEWVDETHRILDTNPPWADVDRYIAGLRPDENTSFEWRYGVPFRSLRASVAFNYGGRQQAVRTLAGTHVGRQSSPFSGVDLAPTGPIWPGLLADTAIFGVAWLMVLEIGPARRCIRARRRVARGQCLGCAYHRAGLPPTAPCPECGMIPNPS